MSMLRISRRRLLGAGAAGTLGVLLAPGAVLADDQGEAPELLRWDLVMITNGVVIAGGADVARDAATGDTGTLTGSGQAQSGKQRAAGGGTFVHRHSDGTEVAHGVYFVTGFRSFVNGGGSLVGTGLIDGVGILDQTTGGVLTLDVHLIAASGQTADGVLEVHCRLPRGRTTTEGVRLSTGLFRFVEQSGFTLFHALEN